jgi:hypothetical protein
MRILLTFVASFFCFGLFSQNGILEGIVTDDKGLPIEGAEIIYKKDFTRGARSDEKGFYQMELPSGTARIVCRFTDMKNDTSTVTIISGQTLTYNFQLRSFRKFSETRYERINFIFI